jgi:hypothetical protein
MSEINKAFEQIDKLLAVARTIDNFQNCETVYDLFGIKNWGASYPDIEKNIEEFLKKYAGTNAPKFKTLGKIISGEAEVVKKVLKDNRREYNDYLRANDPRVKQIRQHFDFCTKYDGELDSKEKADLIAEGTGLGLTQAETLALIAQWLIETGAIEVEDGSYDSTTGKLFPDYVGKTYYEILGVAQVAEYAEIKDAYEREHVKYNTSREKAKASARFFVVSEAWDCLKDPQKRKKYDFDIEQLHRIEDGPPVLKVICNKNDYVYIGVKKGDKFIETIVIKNDNQGQLKGAIVSDSGWLVPERENLTSKHEQQLEISILTSKIPINAYDTKGTVTIITNGGPPYLIHFRVILEGHEISANRFRKTYAPLVAACGGFIFSFGGSPFFGFLFGAFFAGLIAYASAIQVVKLFLSKGIDIFKHPPILINLVAAGVVILTIMCHSGSGSVARKASYTPVAEPAPAPAPVPAQMPETPTINLTKAIVAIGLDNNQIPLGVNTTFPTGNKRLYYYVSYDGGIPDQTVFYFRWYKEGNPIKENQFTLKYATGNVWSYLDYDFQPGQYEAQVYADGRQLSSSSFNVTTGSADNLGTEKQRQQGKSMISASLADNRNPERLPGRFPEASSRYLSQSDVVGLNKEDLTIMRNEIYARHGYIFKSNKKIESYFSQQSWYIPKYNNVDNMLTPIENANTAFVKGVERQK